MTKERNKDFGEEESFIQLADNRWREREPQSMEDHVPCTIWKSERIRKWLLCAASLRGKSHAHAGEHREDAFDMAWSDENLGPDWWALAVSDGAGSRRYSRVGANLAVRTVMKSLQNDLLHGIPPMDAIKAAVLASLKQIKLEAGLRGLRPDDFACTLLVVLWIETEPSQSATALTFQAGDGLICFSDSLATLIPMAQQDSESFAGATHFLTSHEILRTWDRRFSEWNFEHRPTSIIVMSDGVADDLIPYRVNGPILMAELLRIREHEQPGMALAELLKYEKRGSFDDRTLAFAVFADGSSNSKEGTSGAAEMAR